MVLYDNTTIQKSILNEEGSGRKCALISNSAWLCKKKIISSSFMFIFMSLKSYTGVTSCPNISPLWEFSTQTHERFANLKEKVRTRHLLTSSSYRRNFFCESNHSWLNLKEIWFSLLCFWYHTRTLHTSTCLSIIFVYSWM